MNEWSIFCANGGEGNVSVVFFVQMVGTNPGKWESVWEEKIRWLNPWWLNSRWLPSSSWVRMNEFKSDWISLSQSQSGVRVILSESERRKQGVWIQHGRIQDGSHHQVESEWMSEGFFCANGGNQSWQVWVSLRGKTKVAESKMVEFKMASWVRMNEFESDWISLSQSQSGVRVFLSESERRKQGVWIQHGRIQDDCHHQVESEWMSEVFLIQHGRIQDGCHH